MRSESRIKTKTIGVRASPGEKEKLKARAAAFGISVAELCREVVFNSTPRSKTDLNAIAELCATRADLGRLGGLLKGWLAGSFPAGVPQSNKRADISSLVKEIQEAEKRVIDAVKKVAK